MSKKNKNVPAFIYYRGWQMATNKIPEKSFVYKYDETTGEKIIDESTTYWRALTSKATTSKKNINATPYTYKPISNEVIRNEKKWWHKTFRAPNGIVIPGHLVRSHRQFNQDGTINEVATIFRAINYLTSQKGPSGKSLKERILSEKTPVNITEVTTKKKSAPFYNPNKDVSSSLVMSIAEILELTPKKQTGPQLIKKAIEQPYMFKNSGKGSYLSAPQEILKYIDAFQEASEMVVFDLETLGGEDIFGKQHFDFITEFAAINAVKDSNGKWIYQPDSNFSTLLGLSQSDANQVKSVLSGFLDGKVDYSSLTTREKVYVDSLYKYAGATAELDTNGLYRLVDTKYKIDDIPDLIRRSSKKDVIEKVKSGISFLEEHYDEKTYNATKAYAQSMGANGKLVAGANISQYDIPFLRSFWGNDFVPDNIYDITSIIKASQSINDFSNPLYHTSDGGGQVQFVHKLLYPKSESFAAHNALADTKAEFEIISHKQISEIHEKLKKIYGDIPEQSFHLGGIYTPTKPIGIDFGFYYDKINGITIGSEGSRITKHKNYKENFEYTLSLIEDRAYAVTGFDEIDLANSPKELVDNFRKNYTAMRGGKGNNINELYAVRLSPIDPIKNAKNVDYDIIMFMQKEELSSFFSSLNNVGEISDFSNIRNNNVSDEVREASLKAQTVSSYEKAVRKYADNPYAFDYSYNKLLKNKNDSVAGYQLKLSNAIASRDQDAIEKASKELSEFIYNNRGNVKLSNTIEARNNFQSLLPYMHDHEQLFTTIVNELKKNGVEDEHIPATYNEVIRVLSESVNPIDHKLTQNPRKYNSLRISIPSIVSKNAKNKTHTINFDNQYAHYKIIDNLYNKSGINLSNAADIGIAKLEVTKKFLSDAILDPEHGKQIEQALTTNGLIGEEFDKEIKELQSKWAKLSQDSSKDEKYINETISDEIQRLSTRIYQALQSDNTLRSKPNPEKLPFMQLFEIDTSLRDQFTEKTTGRKIDDIFQFAADIASITPTQYVDYLYDKDSGKINEAVFKGLTDSLFDSDLLGDEYKKFLENKGFSSKHAIEERATLVKRQISSYREILKDMLSAFNYEGVQFVNDGYGLYAFDDKIGKTRLVLPEFKIANNGAVYIQQGKQQVMLENKAVFRNGKVDVENIFDTIQSGYRNVYNFILEKKRKGEAINADSVEEYLKLILGAVGKSPTAFGHSAAHFNQSGATINLTDIYTNLFDTIDKDGKVVNKGLESFGYLDGFIKYMEEFDPVSLKKMREAFNNNAYKYSNRFRSYDGTLLTYSQELYEYINNPKILSQLYMSIADKLKKDGKDVGSLFEILNIGSESEKNKAADIATAGSTITRYADYMRYVQRPVGWQTAKSLYITDEDLINMGAVSVDKGIFDLRSTNSVNRLKNVDGVEGLNAANRAVFKEARFSQAEIADKIKKELSDLSYDEQIKRLKEYTGLDFTEKDVKRIIEKLGVINTENDGATALARLSLHTPRDPINSPFKWFDEKHKPNPRSFILQIELDKNGAFRINYSDEIFVKRGASLKFFKKTKELNEEIIAKDHSLVGGRFLTSEGIELSEQQAKKLVEPIINSDHVKLRFAKMSQEEQIIFINNELAKIGGTRYGVRAKSVSSHIKLGTIEEKTFAQSILDGLTDFKGARKILSKYKKFKKYRDVFHSALTKDAFDFIMKDIGASEEDIEKLSKYVTATSDILENILGIQGQNVTNINNSRVTKHKSESMSFSSMFATIVHEHPQKDDPKFLKEFYTKVFGVDISDPNNIENADNIKYNHEKIEEYYEEARKGMNDHVFYTVAQNLQDWTGKKTSNQLLAKKRNIIKKLNDGKIDVKEAHRLIEKLELDADGVKVDKRSIDILRRQTIDNMSMYDFLSANDTSSIKHRNRMIQAGIIEKIDGRYVVSNDAYGRSFFERTLESIDKEAMMGQNSDYALHLSDYLSSDNLDYLSEYQKRLIDKYGKQSAYKDYTLDKLEKHDILQRYGVTRQINYATGYNAAGINNIISKSGINNTIDLSDSNVRTLLVDRYTDDLSKIEALGENNIYTNDTIFDLGKDFEDIVGNKNGRFIATVGLPVNYYNDGEKALLEQYQSSINRMVRSAQDYYNIDNMDDDYKKKLYNIHGVNNDIDLKKKLKAKVMADRDDVLTQQNKAMIGKHSILSEIRGIGIQGMSTMNENQTLNVSNDFMNSRKFDGITLQEHMNNGMMFDVGIMDNTTAKRMGLYDKNFMSSYIEGFGERQADDLKAIRDALGKGATDEAVMHEILSTHGIDMFGGRYPVIFDESISPVHMYIHDGLNNETVSIMRHTQGKWNADNDSDKSFFFRTIGFVDEEAMNYHYAAARKNYRQYTDRYDPKIKEDFKLNVDYSAIASARTFDNKPLINIETAKEMSEAQQVVKDYKYRDSFIDAYKENFNDDDLDLGFEKISSELSKKLGIDNINIKELKNVYASQVRIDRAVKASTSASSNGGVGYINNPVSEFFDMSIEQFGELAMFSTDHTQRRKYEVTRSMFRGIRGDTIEKVINAKNRVDDSSSHIVSVMHDAMSNLVTGFDGDTRNESWNTVKNTLIGSEGNPGALHETLKTWIDDNYIDGSPLKAFFDDNNITKDRKDFYYAAEELLMNTAGEVVTDKELSSWDLRNDFALRNKFGVMDGPAYSKKAYNLDDIDYWNHTFYRDVNMFDTVSDTIPDVEMPKSYTSSTTSSSTVRKTVGDISSSLLSNVSLGKGLAVGALGLAATIMVTGFIGGNPSEDPQSNAKQVVPEGAYKVDNYNYDTGTVMYPPMVDSQPPQRGYVVNMRASTRGNINTANRYIAQSVQQSYGATNLNVNVRQTFSYSGTKESNDRYVENILSRMMS